MCNRIVQEGKVIKPGERTKVLLRGPGGEFEIEYQAVFGGPARSESKNYWLHRERAEEVIIPGITAFGELGYYTADTQRSQPPVISFPSL